MATLIDLGSEWLIDRSTLVNPYLRLLVAAIGEELVASSPWVTLNKRLALRCGLRPNPGLRAVPKLHAVDIGGSLDRRQVGEA